jgi:soluble lytic murein transglycosylase-like protein
VLAGAAAADGAQRPLPARSAIPLRLRLEAALAEPVSFEDRYDAEVWLTDMAGRLARRVPDPHERIEILQAVHREAVRAKLPPEMVLAVIDVESGFQRYAVSQANAQGLMQVMRFWLKELDMPGHALLDIQDNVRMGCIILAITRHGKTATEPGTGALLRRLGSQKYPQRIRSPAIPLVQAVAAVSRYENQTACGDFPPRPQ